MAEMLVGKRRCAQSSNSNTQNDAQSSCEKQNLVEDATINNNNSTARQSNLSRLSPELTTNDGLGDNADVCAVVGKAKKAAQFLWVLIHAQNCNIGGDRCPHKGCVEAKRVLLHLKTCPAETCAQACPSNYNWCHQARKLLSHYQKCREIRAKQAGMGRRPKNQQHACLVCSLVARHARNVLEIPSRKTGGKKQVIASFTLAKDADIDSQDNHRESQFAMPPPPPRQRITKNRQPSNSDLSSSDELVSYHSQPPRNRNQLMLFSEVAAAAAPPHIGDPFDPSVLTENLDDKRSPFLTFAASALQDLRRASPGAEDLVEESKVHCRSVRRSRAESYDERALKQKPAQFEPVDPTIELDLKGEQDIGAEVVLGGEKIVRRARSASLGILASACISHESNNCDTIVEENADT